MPDNRYQTWPEFSLENIKYTRHTLSSQTLAITYQAPTIRRLLPTSLPWPLPPPTLNSLHCIQSSKLASAVGPPSSWVPCLELFLEVVTGLVPSLCLGLSQNVTYAEGTQTVQSGLDYGSRLFPVVGSIRTLASVFSAPLAVGRARTPLCGYRSPDLPWPVTRGCG